MAQVTIVFMLNGEKYKDSFCHFDGTTQRACLEYWCRGRKDREKIMDCGDILEIIIVNHWEKEDEQT